MIKVRNTSGCKTSMDKESIPSNRAQYGAWLSPWCICKMNYIEVMPYILDKYNQASIEFLSFHTSVSVAAPGPSIMILTNFALWQF